MPQKAADLLSRLVQAATLEGFDHRIYGTTAHADLMVLQRDGKPDGPRIYVSAGIHGDEPAGPETLFRLLETSACLPDATWTLFPLINPEGYNLGTRENADGLDLNRDYRFPTANESTAHRAEIDALGPQDLTLALHEDWESKGFYLYELNSSPIEGIANAALEAAAREGPIDLSTRIDGRRANNGVIHAPAGFFDRRDDWPEQIFLFKTHTPICYTFETPSTFPLEQRVRMQTAACRSALATFCRQWHNRLET